MWNSYLIDDSSSQIGPKDTPSTRMIYKCEGFIDGYIAQIVLLLW